MTESNWRKVWVAIIIRWNYQLGGEANVNLPSLQNNELKKSLPEKFRGRRYILSDEKISKLPWKPPGFINTGSHGDPESHSGFIL